VSPDGRFVVFSSDATDLVSNDTNGVSDVFVRDLRNGTTALVSSNRTGTDSGNGRSGINPGSLLAPFAISANGRFVVFGSIATDLVTIPTSGRGDIFVRDLHAGQTSLVSVNVSATGSGDIPTGDLEISPSSISADGRFITFSSTAGNLVVGDHNGGPDVFVRDLQLGMTTLVSVNQTGTGGGNRSSVRPSMSANGRFIAFASPADDLVSNDTNGGQGWDVFVRDLRNGTTVLISSNRLGIASGNGGSDLPLLSADGRFVVFASRATDLVAADTNPGNDLFIRPIR
jgi:Tol biopolymer transport system component